MKILKMLSLMAATTFFVGCGGGSGSSTPTTVNPNGLWEGTMTIDGISADAQYIVYNNQIQGYTVGGNAGFSGSVSSSADQLTANYNIYDADTGFAIGSGSATGTVVERTSITGIFSNSIGQSGNINLSPAGGLITCL